MDPDHHAFGESPFFACRLERDGAAVRIELAGEVDLAARPELDRLLSESDGAREGTVLLDLSRVTFLDSTGLHWLVRARDSIARSGGTLAIAVGDGPVRSVLALSGIDRLLPLVPVAAEEQRGGPPR